MTNDQKKKLPEVTFWFLKIILPGHEFHFLKSNFEDLYTEKFFKKGRLHANLWIWKEIIKSVPGLFSAHCYWRISMLKNHLKIALRNILKQKGFSFINIAGLAIGMACCILLLLFINYELGFDTYHENKERIYKMCAHVQIGGTDIRHSGSNALTAGVLKKQYSEVVDSVRFYWKSRIGGIYKKKDFSINRLFYADSTVFNIFSWPLLKGDPQNALKDPFTMVINETTAKKIFPDDDPVGKVLICNNGEKYMITGVFKDIPKYSTMRFNALCSFQTLYTGEISRIFTEWISFNFDTYLLLAKGVDYKEFEQKISGLLEKYAGEKLKAKNAKEKLFLQPLRDIYLRPLNEPVGPLLYVYIFSAIAVFILLIACVNFMNLSTARSTKRALEVGMRKTLGASKRKLINQFLSEALLLSFISLFFGIIIVLLVLPEIRTITNRDLEINIFAMPWLVPGFFLLTLFVGISAGSYPAFFLSSLHPVKILKGKLKSSSLNRRLRRALVIFQFSISTILIICTLIIIGQLNFMKSKDPGFNMEDVIIISISDGKALASREILKEKFNSCSGVISTASASSLPGWGCPSNDKIPQGYTKETTQLMDEINVDEDFIPTMEMKIIAGRNFSKEFGADNKDSIIINETAVKRFGWKNPIGKTIDAFDPNDFDKTNTKIVIGVVKDFYQRPMTRQIDPLYIGNDPSYPMRFNFLDNIVVRVKADNIKKTLSYLEDKWKEVISHRSFNYFFLDEDFKYQFRDVENSRELFSYFTFLAILIGCLGLLGLAAFTAEQRTKEIGIRKVLGSSVTGIVVLLCKELILLISVANIIAWPIAEYFSKQWLLGFPYRTDITLRPFIISAILVLFISFTIIAYNAIKAAVANPLKSLKYE